ncbi:hypothetical protein [Pseudomonas mediterranea]|uniref:hypothetical protein n=1 Tax=Pseudomonas mediterranea TaxID=183795 RepID=UPI0006D8D752|nr:hypothetical protein [Pseudomonas mediterranea]
MSKFSKNTKKKGFIERFPQTSLETSDIESRCKFNFSFFDDTQLHGSSLNGLEPGVLASIMEKVKSYSCNDLNYWRNQRCGSKGLKILADYDTFPPNSRFLHPKFVPHDVTWSRFRMENLSRLIGFTIPGDMKKTRPGKFLYDTNTFYVVFIDLEHNFYPIGA